MSETSKRPLRIAVFHNGVPGGAKRALSGYMHALAKRGHVLDLYTFTTSDEDFGSLSDVVRHIERIPCPRYEYKETKPYVLEEWLNFGRRVAHARQVVAASRALAEHITTAHYDLLWADICQFLHAPSILRCVKVPTFYYCHEPFRAGYEGWTRKPSGGGSPAKQLYQWFSYAARETKCQWLTFLDRRNATAANAIGTNSFYTRLYIQRVYRRSAEVCYPGVDIERFRPLDLPRENVVLGVGGTARPKRFDLLVQAIGRLDPAIRPQLVIVGNQHPIETRDEIVALAKRLGVQLAIHAGISDEQLVQWYNRAKVVMYTAVREPFGLVALEAMACGTPVIGVREGGLQESILDGQTGLLVDPNPEACAEGLKKLLADEPLRQRMGVRGRQCVTARWTWDQAAERVERVLYGLAGSAHHNGNGAP